MTDKINKTLPHDMNKPQQAAENTGEYALSSEVLRGLNSPPAENFSFAGMQDKTRAMVKH